MAMQPQVRELRAVARTALRLDRRAADIRVTNRWDAIEALQLLRRDAHIIQTGPTRWIVRVGTSGRSVASVAEDLAAVAAWAAERARGEVNVAAGDRVVELAHH